MSIKVYCKHNCMQCNFVKKELDANGIQYVEVYIDEDPEEKEKIRALGYQGVPVVMADGHEPFYGFHPDKLAEIIEDET